MGKLTKPQRKHRNYSKDYSKDGSLKERKCRKESSSSSDGQRISNQTNQGSQEAIDEGT